MRGKARSGLNLSPDDSFEKYSLRPGSNIMARVDVFALPLVVIVMPDDTDLGKRIPCFGLDQGLAAEAFGKR